MNFHEAIEVARYYFDELVTHGFTDLDSIMYTFGRITRASSFAELEATFWMSYDYILDAAISNCPHPPDMRTRQNSSDWTSTDFHLARQLLMESAAARRPSVKLEKMVEAIDVLSQSDSSVSADELLETLSIIVPTVPLIRETVFLMRSFLDNCWTDQSLLVGPAGYALTSLEAVLGSTL